MSEQATSCLPHDIARCAGVSLFDEDGLFWREGCEDCLRRLAPSISEHTEQMQPPAVITFECAYRIPRIEGSQ